MNKAILLGRLTKDPEVKTVGNGSVCSTFTLAVNRRFASKDSEQTADFINIVTWGKTAEFCGLYFKKGMQISLVGRIQTRTYDDATGVKRYVTEVVGEEVYFAGGNTSDKNSTQKETEKSENTVNFSDFDSSEFMIETEDDIEM